MENYFTLLSVIAPVFLIIAVGMAIRRLSWLSPEADNSLLNLVVKLLYPCLILNAVLDNAALAKPENLLLAPLVGFLTLFIGFTVAWVVISLFPADTNSRKRTFIFTVGIYNYGYIPIPLVQQLFDRETLGVLFLHNVGVEAGFWTIGILLLTGTSLRNGWKRLINPPVMALAFGLFLNFTGIVAWLPVWFLQGIGLLGACAIPLGLLLIGATLCDFGGKAAMSAGWRTPLLASLLRLGLLPVLFLLLAITLPLSLELKRVLVIQAAMPAGILPIVIARHYGGDIPTALAVVLGTTVLSLLLIPVWLHIGFTWVGV